MPQTLYLTTIIPLINLVKEKSPEISKEDLEKSYNWSLVESREKIK